MDEYAVWHVYLNRDTFNFGGQEWVVDGECGRDTFPGSWPRDKAVRYYRNGWGFDHKEEEK